MADLGQAYVQIVPKATGISGKIGKLLDPGSKEAGDKAGTSIAGGIKKALVAAGIGVAVGSVIKGAVAEGGKLEQSFGGLETIYGKASEQAKRFAWNASKAGISANEYAEQAVSFGASLKQAFAGDTTKAVKAADTAIMDMTDNAAKMGTPIENIQNAYQGFAKQNYTMLDNLKLGYGGTKTEMERLLSDAEKLSGQEYNIDNLGDVYDAIHVIQEDLGLTGVAAKEASETFEGSFNAMKANAKNLLGELALGGEEVGPMMAELVDSVVTFLFDNLLPMVGNVFKGLPEAITTAVQEAGPRIIETGKAILDAVVNGIKTYAPMVIEAIPAIIDKIKNAIVTYGPSLLEQGKNLLESIGKGIQTYAPVVLSYLGNAITTFTQFIQAKLPEWAAKGADMLRALAKSFVEHIPEMLAALGELAVWILTRLGELVSALLVAGAELLAGLAQGILDGIGSFVGPAVKSVVEAIKKPIEAIKSFFTGVWNNIKQTTTSAWNSIKSMAVSVWNAIKTSVTRPITSLKSTLSSAWSGIKSTASSAWNNIKSAMMKPIETARDKIKGIIDKVKSFFPLKIGNLFSGLKLPHFKVSGKPPFGIGGKGEKPGISVSWYAQGGIVDGATLIGAGEAGPEAILPLDPFWKKMDDIAGSMQGGDNYQINLNYNASDDANKMLLELARGIKRYKRAGAF